MALEQKLSLKLAQRLVMTPSLQQAIKLLQMTRFELEGVLAEEMVENPVLEEGEVNAEDAEANNEEDAKDEEQNALDDIDLEAYFGDHAEPWEGSGQASVFEEKQGPPLENILTREPDLYDHLLWQLHMMDVPPLRREIAELIIGNLDAEGFLTATVREIIAMGADGFDDPTVEPADPGTTEAADAGAAVDASSAPAVPAIALDVAGPPPEGSTPTSTEDAPLGAEVGERAGTTAEDGIEDELVGATAEEIEEPDPPGYPRAEVEAALELVRNLDPPGIACVDLQESLLQQLGASDEPRDSLLWRVIEEKWELLRKRKFELIAKQLGVPLADLRPVVDAIRQLQTRPGRAFSNDRTQYVEPDVYVVKVGERYVVQLNDDGLPRLRVSRAYRRLLQEMRKEGRQNDAQQFIKEKMRSAVWLIKSLDQRQRTIYKVTSSIVQQQRAFLDYGIDHLRPMVLRDVAEDIEMHESTVSRVVSNKYVHTPRGLFPLKFFFHSGIDREYGGDISSLTVKRKIKHLVQEEDPKKPLSDSELMRILKREGIQIARRTVAKYRDELRIPSSTERKQIF